MSEPHAHPHLRWAVGWAVALHLAAAGLIVLAPSLVVRKPAPPPEDTVAYLADIRPAESPPVPVPVGSTSAPTVQTPTPAPDPVPTAQPEPIDPQPPKAFMAAPPAPTAEEWAQAATYTLKNSKRYRYHWGQHVRSLMGTAHQGPEQGAVRFRIEVAPNGQLAQLDTLWTTSPAVEQRARQAIQRMPALPPTPNGQPLVFEKTIVFDAFTAEAPPLYKNDCEPDPPQHGNRFAWDGRSLQHTAAAEPEAEKLDPAAYAECLKQLPQDSIEAEAASDERQQKQWASPTLGR